MSRAGDLRTLLDGPDAGIRDMVRDWLSQPGHAPVADLPREAYRAQVTAWAQELAMDGGTAMGYPPSSAGSVTSAARSPPSRRSPSATSACS